MTDDLSKKALELVSRWEHGDDGHREWLRNIAAPDIAPLYARIADLERQLAEARRVVGNYEKKEKSSLKIAESLDQMRTRLLKNTYDAASAADILVHAQQAAATADREMFGQSGVTARERWLIESSLSAVSAPIAAAERERLASLFEGSVSKWPGDAIAAYLRATPPAIHALAAKE